MSTIRRALFATEFESIAFPCLEVLFAFRAAGLEEIVFLYVIDRDEVGFTPYGGFDRELSEELRQTASLRFQDWGKRAEAAGLRFRAIEELGRPAVKILEVAAREGADLIVTARPHEHVGDALYARGTAMDLVRESPVPVLVCKGEGAECSVTAPDSIGHVLYATDFGEDCGPALEFLGSLRDVIQKVSVVHVLESRELRDPANEEADERRVGAACEDLRQRGIDAEAHLLAGEALPEILREASDSRCDMILMSTRRKSALGELIHGSVSHRVAVFSPIPVLLVPCEDATESPSA